MTTVTIRDVPISFPFDPYNIQKDYMEKVLECLQMQKNGVLESPTGTGKTLSLLCSSLAWLTLEKAKIQAEVRSYGNQFLKKDKNDPTPAKRPWDIPTIIYATRTHSQLTQAMRELKRTSYSYVRAAVLGSRDQLCVHPDVSKQANNAAKIHLCQALVKTRTCSFHNRVERMSLDRVIQEKNILDIEDLAQLGNKHKFCPFYMTKEVRKNADIMFLPYNYLLDPKARRAQQIELKNAIVILDEAHNVERICEDSASFQIRSTDIALCIDEVTQIMKIMEKANVVDFDGNDKDFSPEDLMLLKTMLLNLEEAIDQIPISNSSEGSTFEGGFIFTIFAKAGIDDSSQSHIITLLDHLISYFNTSSGSPFQRSGAGLQSLQDLLLIAFHNISSGFKERIQKCYKVHLSIEETKKETVNTWLSKTTTDKKGGRVLSYWCFSPNFGMEMLLEQGIRCLILTSGTLAPLQALISELGIDIGVRLENPHVVTKEQICVKILGTGPDGVPLNASYQNRDNQNYIKSLGMSIINIARQIPHGLLIFFPSYALLAKCQLHWQTEGLWSTLNEMKPIFVEPRTKDAFVSVMQDFYEKVKDPIHKGAAFMAVCRGKVSEGLDFADVNGRAVIVTGLPYPPLKDPRVVLKRKYLDSCRTKNAECLSGQDWYSLEATRAVNQAIGRVIRHQYDYGAILLLDNRFNYNSIKSQLSLWVRNHLVLAKNFGEIIRDVRSFFQNAQQFALKNNTNNCRSEATQEFGQLEIHEKKYSCLSMPSTSSSSLINKEKEIDELNGNKRSGDGLQNNTKRKKIVILQNLAKSESEEKDSFDYMLLLKKNLGEDCYTDFITSLGTYKTANDIDLFLKQIKKIFEPNPQCRYLIQGLFPYVKEHHRDQFLNFWESARR